ncbi:MAG TPA: S8 family serine peptidase [Thermoleophilaceae bacterium]|nr:S8 family serine peptidase [Thermoleophilaceae bacterium]
MFHRTLRASLLACILVLAFATTAAAADFVPGRVIVKYNAGTSATRIAALENASGVTGLHRTILGGARVVTVAGSVKTAVAQLNRSAAVQYAEPDYVMHATATPNDPRFAELYGLNNTGQTGGTPDADIDAPEGWDAAGLGLFPSTGGAKVGVVDTGILSTHEDLTGKLANCAKSYSGIPILSGSIQEGSCSDDNGHGTHVSGTITANANNGKGVAGVAFNSQLAMCKALGGPLGSGSTSDVANCIRWAHDKGAKVLSMSLGGGASTTLQQAVQYAWANGAAGGTLLVAAAGNDGDATLNYPAAYAEVVSVAATDNNDQRASFSNANSDVEIAAPGVNVLSTYNGSNTSYTTLSGTSMATPHVAGVAAIIWDKYPTATASTIRSKLDASVDDRGAAGRDTSFGFGRVNLQKAATS